MIVAVFGDDAVLTLTNVNASSASVERWREHVTIVRARRQPARVAFGPGPELADDAVLRARQTTCPLHHGPRSEVAALVIRRHPAFVALSNTRDSSRLYAEHLVAVAFTRLRLARRPVADTPTELEAMEVTHLEAFPRVDGTGFRETVDVQCLPARLVSTPDVPHLSAARTAPRPTTPTPLAWNATITLLELQQTESQTHSSIATRLHRLHSPVTQQ